MPLSLRFGHAAATSHLDRPNIFPASGNCTIMGWFRALSDSGVNQYLWDISTVGGNDIQLFYKFGQISSRVNGGVGIAAGPLLPTGVWMHLAMTIKGTSGAGNLLTYANGVQVISSTPPAGAFTGFRIGEALGSTANWINGNLAAMKIYNRVLTQVEIAEEMMYAMPVNPGGLHSAYPFPSPQDVLRMPTPMRVALKRYADYSGNDLAWSETGKFEFDEGPPGVQWAPAVHRLAYRSRRFVLPTILPADFKIQRGTVAFASTTATKTITAGTDYIAPVGPAWIEIKSIGYYGGSSASISDPYESAVYMSNPENLATSITFKTAQAPNTSVQTVAWEIHEYVGPAGSGGNPAPGGFVIRKVEHIAYTSTLTTVSGGVVSGVATNAQVEVRITSQGYTKPPNNQGLTTTGPALYSSAAWNTGAQTADFTRFQVINSATNLSYTVIEWGSNWAINRVSHAMSGTPGTTETLAVTDVGSLTRATIHVQYPMSAATSALGLRDVHPEVWLSATNTLSFKITSVSANSSFSAGIVVWIRWSTQTSGGKLANCNRYTGTYNATGTRNIPVTAISDITQACVMGTSCSSDATGNDITGTLGFNLTTANNVALLSWYQGNVVYHFEVFEYPIAPVSTQSIVPVLMNSYRQRDA